MTDLTDRETAILTAYANGRTRSQAARELRLTRTSIDRYTSALLAKLDAATEAQAVHNAHQRGLFDDARPQQPAGLIRRVWDPPDAIRRRQHELNEALKDYRPKRGAA